MIKNADRTSASSQLRRIFGSLFVVAAAVSLVAAVASSNAVGQRIGGDAVNIANKVAPWVVEHTAYGQQAEFFVVLAERADLRPAANLPTKTEKGRFVYQTLLEKARATQGPILQWLRDRKIEHQSFYIVNAILVKGTRDVAEALAARPEVARVEGNPLIHNNLPQPEPVTEAPSKPQAPKAIEPGITYTHAPNVWGLGFTGEGIVVASADTGVRWTHNALKPHYRGWDGVNADHDYNWHDSIHDSVGNPCGNDSPFPCDDLAHGSHTTGKVIARERRIVPAGVPNAIVDGVMPVVIVIGVLAIPTAVVRLERVMRPAHTGVRAGYDNALPRESQPPDVRRVRVSTSRLHRLWSLRLRRRLSHRLWLGRSEEHTSELQSRLQLLCPLFPSKK